VVEDSALADAAGALAARQRRAVEGHVTDQVEGVQRRRRSAPATAPAESPAPPAPPGWPPCARLRSSA
jgi:hypothetical protein